MTNLQFAERVGITHSTASRLRSGQRLPSLALMRRIAKEFPAFPIDAQLAAHEKGGSKYATELRKRVFAQAAAAV